MSLDITEREAVQLYRTSLRHPDVREIIEAVFGRTRLNVLAQTEDLTPEATGETQRNLGRARGLREASSIFKDAECIAIANDARLKEQQSHVG